MTTGGAVSQSLEGICSFWIAVRLVSGLRTFRLQRTMARADIFLAAALTHRCQVSRPAPRPFRQHRTTQDGSLSYP
jgi:hypothetical protein